MNYLGKTEREYLENLSFTYIQSAKFDTAEVILSALSSCFQHDFHILRSLGYVKLMQNRNEEALTHVQDALRISPNDEVALLIESMSIGEKMKVGCLTSMMREIHDQG